MVVPFGIGAGLSSAIYKKFIDPDIKFTYFMLFAAVAYSITAFPVLCRILTELKLLDTTVGIVVLSAGVGNDIGKKWTIYSSFPSAYTLIRTFCSGMDFAGFECCSCQWWRWPHSSLHPPDLPRLDSLSPLPREDRRVCWTYVPPPHSCSPPQALSSTPGFALCPLSSSSKYAQPLRKPQHDARPTEAHRGAFLILCLCPSCP